MSARVCVESSCPRAKPDVLLVADNGGAGGIERYCVDLAQALELSASVVCLCSEDCSGEAPCWVAEQCRARGLRLITLPMPAKAWLQGVRGLWAVWKAEGRPIVHTNGRRGNFLATLAKMSFPEFGFVTTVHGMLGLHDRRNMAYRLVDIAASAAADAVIAVNAETGRRLTAAGVPTSKVSVITNGLAPDCLATLTAGAQARPPVSDRAGVRVGFLGRLSLEKGIDEFADLADRLSVGAANVTFCVAGDGPKRNDFLQKCESLVASGRLQYLGEVPDPARMLASLDILVMPSHNEGLPYVLLEAMASGCAVAAYGVGGIPEVVTDASVGCLVRPRDFDALLAAVSFLIGQKLRARTIGANASLHVREKYSLARRIPHLLEAYERCSPERAARIARSRKVGAEASGS